MASSPSKKTVIKRGAGEVLQLVTNNPAQTTGISLARSGCQRLLRAVVMYKSHPIEHDALRKSAIVFSPHPDDETLGCGGTIIRKIRAGAEVKIVYMTDGSSSHSRFISPTELATIRTAEALSACRVLGLPGENVVFLQFKDQHLTEFQKDAQEKVVRILSSEKCDEIFIPYSGDSLNDHCATNAIVLRAVEKLRSNVMIYEYPIWFWHHWPWTSVNMSSRGDVFRKIRDILASWVGLMKKFRWSVCISDVLELKRLALEQHKTQMTRLFSNVQWPVLNDVSNGEFLQCFFQNVEVFHRHQLFR